MGAHTATKYSSMNCCKDYLIWSSVWGLLGVIFGIIAVAEGSYGIYLVKYVVPFVPDIEVHLGWTGGKYKPPLSDEITVTWSEIKPALELISKDGVIKDMDSSKALAVTAMVFGIIGTIGCITMRIFQKINKKFLQGIVGGIFMLGFVLSMSSFALGFTSLRKFVSDAISQVLPLSGNHLGYPGTATSLLCVESILLLIAAIWMFGGMCCCSGSCNNQGDSGPSGKAMAPPPQYSV